MTTWGNMPADLRIHDSPRRSKVTAMDLLVVGGIGFLGQEVTWQARRTGARVVATFHRRALPIAGVDWRALDIRHRDGVIALVQQTRPDAIINAAYQQPTGPPPPTARCASPRR